MRRNCGKNPKTFADKHNPGQDVQAHRYGNKTFRCRRIEKRYKGRHEQGEAQKDLGGVEALNPLYAQQTRCECIADYSVYDNLCYIVKARDECAYCRSSSQPPEVNVYPWLVIHVTPSSDSHTHTCTIRATIMRVSLTVCSSNRLVRTRMLHTFLQGA